MPIGIATEQTLADAKATLALLEKHGWGQHAWCQDDGEYCLGGAMAVTISGNYTYSPYVLTAAQRLRFNALARAMDLPVKKTGAVVDWVVAYNDNVAEAADNVKAMLTGAIAHLTEEES